MSQFSRSHDLSLINREVELDLSWKKDFVLLQHNTTGVNFMMTSTKLYVLVVNLSRSNNIKFIEHLKQGFKRTISWSK